MEDLRAAAPARDEDLAAPRVDDGQDERLGIGGHLGQGPQGRDAGHRRTGRLSERAGGGDADAQPGERARAGADGDQVQVGEREPGAAKQRAGELGWRAYGETIVSAIRELIDEQHRQF